MLIVETRRPPFHDEDGLYRIYCRQIQSKVSTGDKVLVRYNGSVDMNNFFTITSMTKRSRFKPGVSRVINCLSRTLDDGIAKMTPYSKMGVLTLKPTNI